jgi:hypothetical protein
LLGEYGTTVVHYWHLQEKISESNDMSWQR